MGRPRRTRRWRDPLRDLTNAVAEARAETASPLNDELGPGLVNQPPLAVGLSPDDEISAQEFEAAWAASTQASP